MSNFKKLTKKQIRELMDYQLKLNGYDVTFKVAKEDIFKYPLVSLDNLKKFKEYLLEYGKKQMKANIKKTDEEKEQLILEWAGLLLHMISLRIINKNEEEKKSD